MIEHQSKIDYSMAYRIFSYSTEIIRKTVVRRSLKNKNYKIPAVYPIVLYTGKRKWNAKQYLEQCQEKLRGIQNLNFASYNLIDVNNYKEKELWDENTLLSKMLLLEKAKKHKNITDYLQKIVKQKLTKQEVHLLMEMIYNSKDIDFCEVKKIVEELKKTKGEDVTMLTPLQEYVEELNKKERKAGRTEGIKVGRTEGIKVGRTEGRKQEKNKIVKKMLQNNIKESIIKKVVNITQKELEEIKAIVAK